MASDQPLHDAINALDRGTRLAIQYSAYAMRNNAAEEGQHQLATFWNELGCLVAELETERDAAWQETQDAYHRVDPPPPGDLG